MPAGTRLMSVGKEIKQMQIFSINNQMFGPSWIWDILWVVGSLTTKIIAKIKCVTKSSCWNCVRWITCITLAHTMRLRLRNNSCISCGYTIPYWWTFNLLSKFSGIKKKLQQENPLIFMAFSILSSVLNQFSNYTSLCRNISPP